jgi:dipeptidase
MIRPPVIRRLPPLALLIAAAATIQFDRDVHACTNIVVSRGASSDGSVFVTYSIDGPGMTKLHFTPAGKQPSEENSDDPIEAEWDGPRYHVVGFINEHQLAIGETTTGGRKELKATEGVSYHQLIRLALRRCKTAQEAITEIDRIIQQHGYAGSGETFSIADKQEAWIMEFIGKGPDEKGAVWVAARVPDGAMTVQANMSRITTFPRDAPENWRYSPDVESFAVREGFYQPDSGKPFSFQAAYHPDIDAYTRRACAGRVWSVYRRSAPSANPSDAYMLSEAGAKPYPLFWKPDKKIGVGDMMRLMRDHFEGTRHDMTKGVVAGPFGSPYRFRELTWEIDGKKYGWERPISTQQASSVFITQSRASLPDAIGGVYWYCPDDAYTGCFAPFYCCIDRLPKPYEAGDRGRFSWDSAWWVFNMVSNYTYDRWSRVLPDVQALQQAQETKYLKMQPIVEETARKLAGEDEELMREYLTNHCVATGDALFCKWRDLAGVIMTRHNDGYVKEPGTTAKGVGYPEPWLKEVVRDRPRYYLFAPSAADPKSP